jgi:hypothetical protein
MQALVTMNDPQFVEAARVLAQKAMLRQEPTWDAALDFMTLRVLARSFTPVERKIVSGRISGFCLALPRRRTGGGQVTGSG